MDTRTKVNTRKEAWTFFKQFTLNTTTCVLQKTSLIGRDRISLSYSSGMVHLQDAQDNCPVRIFDSNGRLVTTAATMQHQFVFKDKPSGVYLVEVSGNNGTFPLKMILP